jgi:hypothetical protein
VTPSAPVASTLLSPLPAACAVVEPPGPRHGRRDDGRIAGEQEERVRVALPHPEEAAFADSYPTEVAQEIIVRGAQDAQQGTGDRAPAGAKGCREHDVRLPVGAFQGRGNHEGRARHDAAEEVLAGDVAPGGFVGGARRHVVNETTCDIDDEHGVEHPLQHGTWPEESVERLGVRGCRFREQGRDRAHRVLAQFDLGIDVVGGRANQGKLRVDHAGSDVSLHGLQHPGRGDHREGEHQRPTAERQLGLQVQRSDAR